MNENVEQWQVRKHAAIDSRGVVAAQHWLAARAGAAILDQGGNAVDAAVATAFALGVVEPWMSGIGGAGYMVVWDPRTARATAFDFQGVLARRLLLEDYPLDPSMAASLMGAPGVRDDRNAEGYGSILVPGAVAGLARALERLGTMGLDRVMSPSLRLLQRGLPVDWHATLMIALEARKLARDPGACAWFLPGGHPPAPEQFLANPALEATYRAIADEGPGTVYGGRVGAAMVADLATGGSRLTLEDFADYEVREADAVSATHRGHVIYTAGPSSGGPRLNDALAHVAQHLDAGQGVGSHAWITYAEALDYAFDRHHARLGQATPDLGCTTHVSVVDAEGSMAALTFTLLNRFGSGVVLPRTGVLMNNSVAYFDPRPGLSTSLRGGLRINASNMCPTIAVENDAGRFAVGASGANHIVPCVFQLTALMLDFGLDLETAFHTPRVDASARGTVRADPRMGREALEALGARFDLEVAQTLVFPKLYACPSGVARDPATGSCSGIADVSSPVAGAATPAPFPTLPSELANTRRA